MRTRKKRRDPHARRDQKAWGYSGRTRKRNFPLWAQTNYQITRMGRPKRMQRHKNGHTRPHAGHVQQKTRQRRQVTSMWQLRKLGGRRIWSRSPAHGQHTLDKSRYSEEDREPQDGSHRHWDGEEKRTDCSEPEHKNRWEAGPSAIDLRWSQERDTERHLEREQSRNNYRSAHHEPGQTQRKEATIRLNNRKKQAIQAEQPIQ